MRLLGRYTALIFAFGLSASVLRAEQQTAQPQQAADPAKENQPAAATNQPMNNQQAKKPDAAGPVALSIVKVERTEQEKEKIPGEPVRPSAIGFVDVMAGDELVITVNRTLVPQARYEARFDAKSTSAGEVAPLRAYAWPTGEKTLVTRAPIIDSWQPRELRVVVDDDGQAQQVSTNGFPLRIAPSANAMIEIVSPTVVEWNSPLKVTGRGFFAPPERIVVKLGEITVRAKSVSPTGDWFSTVIPESKVPGGNKYDAGVRDLSVTVWTVPAQLPEELRTANKPLQVTLRRAPGGPTETVIIVATFLTAASIAGLLYAMYRTLGRKRGLAAALLLDPETQTYSLARAQFFWWTTIIAIGYLFLFYGHGLHQGIWNFPPLEGFAYTFMISLGTLLLAQATTSVKGAKGAGVVSPSPADLIVHGGVLAPERVQQVVWTVLAGVAFIWIIYKTYTTSTGLPEIPNEMLALMGISSAGYLGGKLARKAGPVIQRVEVGTGSVVLRIFGQHLSISPRILIDGVELARENVSTLEPDPDEATEFAKALKVTVPDGVAATPDDWFSRKRLVAIINADTQRAEWEVAVPVVTDIQAGDQAADGQRTITVSGSGLALGTTVILPDATELPLTADPSGTRATVTTNKWPASEADIVIRGAQMGRTTFHWTPVKADEKKDEKKETTGTTTGAGGGAGTTDDQMRQQMDQAAEQKGTAQTE